MTTFQYDFSETSEGGDFVTPDPGVYGVRFTEVEKKESRAGNPMAVVRFQVTRAAKPAGEIYVGGIFTQRLVTTGKGAFRFRGFLLALGSNTKDKGQINLKKAIGQEIGVRLALQAGDEPDENGDTIYFPDVKAFFSKEQLDNMLGAAKFSDDEDEEDEEIEDEVEEEEDVEEDVEEEEESEDEESEDEEDEEEDEEDDEEGLTWEDLQSMSITELKAIAKENGIRIVTPKPPKKLTKAMVLKKLEPLFEDEGEDEDEDEDDPF